MGAGSEPEDQHDVLVLPSSQHSQTPAPLVEAEKELMLQQWEAQGLGAEVGRDKVVRTQHPEYGAAPESAAAVAADLREGSAPTPWSVPQSRGPAPAPGPWLTSHCPQLCPGVCAGAGGTQLEADLPIFPGLRP